jgi:amino acid permease
VHGGNAPVVAVGSGTATVASEIFNLVKAIVGVGVLSLPAGIAAFGDAPSALVPALALIAIIGVLSGYGFAIIGRVCK